MERKALYNSLRFEALEDEPVSWKTEDYRSLSSSETFERLNSLGIVLDKLRFLALGEEVNTPEDLYELIVEDEPENPELGDQIYLLLFELWRRFLPEKQSLSIFGDELDELIHRFDLGDKKAEEPLEIALDTFQNLLLDSKDAGDNPGELFNLLKENTAIDIEPFLYDFISEQIENRDYSYAEGLTIAFLPFVSDKRWFQFLKAKCIINRDNEEGSRLFYQIMKENQKNPDLDLNLEMLGFFAKEGEGFKSLLLQTLPLVTLEEEFIDILASAEEYFELRDLDAEEEKISEIRKKRAHKCLEDPFSQKDPDVAILRGLNFR